MMSPWRMSVLLWLGGAVAGAAIGAVATKKHPIKDPLLGGLLGAILVGSFGDKAIELHHPNYDPNAR